MVAFKNIKTAEQLQQEKALQRQIAAKMASLQKRTDPEKLLKALESVAALVVKPALDTLDDPDATAPLFPDFSAGEAVAVDDVRNHEGILYRVIQSHMTQEDWLPPDVPALWVRVKAPDSAEWVAGIQVTVGEEYTYQGVTYRVIQSHQTQSGWEPPNVPALWEAV